MSSRENRVQATAAEIAKRNKYFFGVAQAGNQVIANTFGYRKEDAPKPSKSPTPKSTNEGNPNVEANQA